MPLVLHLRDIIHLDADAFFASVEQSADSRLRGKPVAVGGEKRGIIASASYEARKFGIYTPMPTVMARRLCPKLILLPGDFEKYELFSRLMFSYAYDFTPDVEIGSIDEGYLDLTGARKPALTIAQTIRDAIHQALKLSVSEGIGTSKLISQIASKLHKPAGFQLVAPGEEARFLSPLPNKWLPGIGPKTSTQLNSAGLAHIGQIAQTPADLLSLLVGNMARQLHEFALGIDERPVIPAHAPAKSYGEQETFAKDTTDEAFLDATLRRMADKLMAKVREDGKSIRTLAVKVRYNDMDEEQASESLHEPTNLETDIYSKVSQLLRKAWRRRVSLRLVSLRLSNVFDGIFCAELGLDIPSRQHEAQQRLARTVDDLRHKFGRSSLLRGHDFTLQFWPLASESPSDPQSGCPPDLINPSLQRGVNASETPPNRFNGLPAPLEPGSSPYKLAIIERQRLGNYAASRHRIPPPNQTPIKSDQAQSNLIKPDQTKNFSSPLQPSPNFSKTRSSSSSPAMPNRSQDRIRPSNRAFFSPSPDFVFRPTSDPASRIEHPVSFVHCSPLSPRTSYLPLNLHSYYSFLDSTLSIDAIIELAKLHNLPAIALTDKNNLHGAVEFAQAAAKAGIKPIIGVEVQLAGKHACLYVQNQTGYRNLCRILSPKSKVQGPKSLERSDFGLSTDGLLAVSPFPDLAALFPDRFYLEVTSLESWSDLIRHSSFVIRHLPAVASFPIHYASPSDRWKYDIVQSIRTLTLLRQQHPEKRLDGDFHFRSPAEMQKLFSARPDLLRNTLEIADRCSFEFSLGTPQFPGYTPPNGLTPAAYLRQLVMEGLHRRYPKDHARLRPQLEEELAIITEVGYEEYFLVMWDILQECRRRGIEWITRGSAADSLACYCLEISGVCPIRFDLYFRRFLNKDRMALNKLPDIDVDFPHDRKDDVIDLIFEKFGTANTAIVGGFSTFQSRSAFAEVAKVLGASEFQVRRITERLPHFSRASELPEAVVESQECRDLPLEEEPYRTALQMAHFLDGFPRYPKMHPCGLVLSHQPMDELVPCFTSAKGYPTTHFDMDSVEAIGLIKMDILAQGGLAVMRDVQESLQKLHQAQQSSKSECQNPNAETSNLGIHSSFVIRDSSFESTVTLIDLASLEPWEDRRVWNLIASGTARAVHHIESPAMISLCKMCNVKDIDTLIAIVSVIRPGAANESKKMEFARRYQRLSPVRYPHPSLEACLRSTFGLVVYEEHILQICEAFAGLPPGRADILRRALGKGKTDIIAQIQTEFADCARKLGRTEPEIAEVWELVAGFAGYAFCKAHSTAYGVEAYQSAWLKLNYPAEFMAAVLTNAKGFYDPLVYVLECHRLGIPLLPPSINQPGPQFTVVRNQSRASRKQNPNAECRMPKQTRMSKSEEAKHPRNSSSDLELRDSLGFRHSDFGISIRIPLTNIKGLTLQTKETILRERARAPFSSLQDFITRVQPLNEEMEALIRAGAFDEFGKPRTTQYWEFKTGQRLYNDHSIRRHTQNSKLKTQNSKEAQIPKPALSNYRANVPSNLELQDSFKFQISNFKFSLPLSEPNRLQCLRWEEELLGYPASGHPLDLYPDIAWDTYCPINRLGEHTSEQIVTCGLVIEQRLFHQITGEPMKFITITDWTGIIETELFARTYRSYGLNTIRYKVLEITATVEPFDNNRGYTLRVLRAGKPRARTRPCALADYNA